MIGKFTKNILITFGTRVFQLLLGIGSSVIIARMLGPQGRGIYSLAILLPGLLAVFANLGIGPASVFYIGKKKYSPKEIFGTNIIFAGLISIFTIIIGLIIVFFFPEKLFPGVPKECLFLALSVIPLQFFSGFAVHILLGLQKIKKYNFIQLIQNFIFLFLIIVFLLGLRFGVKSAIIAEILSVFVGCAVLFFQTKKETNGIVFSLNREILRDFFSYGSKVYLGNIFSFLHYRIDMFMVNIFLNPVAVGFYSIAVTLAEKIGLISESTGTILFPQVSSETNKERLNKFTPLVCRNTLFITMLTAIFLFLIGRWLIILLYSKEFSDSVLPFQILLIGSITISGWRILANDLYGRGKPLLNSYITGISVIINIILNIIFIPKFGISGASWATAISYTVALIMITIVYSRISGNRIVDIIFIKKSDLRYYKNFLTSFKNRAKSGNFLKRQ